MKLVGASNSFVRMPFMIEGFLCGVFAALLAMVAILGLVEVLTNAFESIVATEGPRRIQRATSRSASSRSACSCSASRSACSAPQPRCAGTCAPDAGTGAGVGSPELGPVRREQASVGPGRHADVGKPS